MVGKSNTGAVPSSECKIRQVGDAFFAIGGHPREELARFDAVKIATEALRSSGNAAAKVKAFEQSILLPLTELVRTVKSKAPAYFDEFLRDKPVLGVAFFGNEQHSLYLYVRSYRAKVYNSTEVRVEIENITDCTKCVRALGENDAIDQFIKKNPKYYLVPSVELVRKLVQLQIDQKPETVGAPIDIIRVDKKGAKWVEVKPECK